MKNILFYLFAFLTIIGCSSKKDTYKFEKIIFHSSRCFGSCPVINLQVKNDKSILLSRTKNSAMSKLMDDTNKEETESFKGTLNDELYQQLITELAKTQDLNFDGPNCCDAPLKTLIVYQNGKRKEIETMFPPKEAQKLIGILYEISKLENLTKVTEKIDIETIKEYN